MWSDPAPTVQQPGEWVHAGPLPHHSSSWCLLALSTVSFFLALHLAQWRAPLLCCRRLSLRPSVGAHQDDSVLSKAGQPISPATLFCPGLGLHSGPAGSPYAHPSLPSRSCSSGRGWRRDSISPLCNFCLLLQKKRH